MSAKRLLFAGSFFAILSECYGKGWWRYDYLDWVPGNYNMGPDKGNFPFLYGVGSADPTATSVLLWTRVNSANSPYLSPHPSGSPNIINVSWALWQDGETFDSPFLAGLASAEKHDDYTLTVLADGLSPNTYYYYQFRDVNGNL